MKTILIIGCRGQDGQLLAQLARSDGDQVYGLSRYGLEKFSDADWVAVSQGEIWDLPFMADVLQSLQPDEIYYLAAFHHSSQDPPVDPDQLERLSQLTHVEGLETCLKAISKKSEQSRLFYAASALIFGRADEAFQTEQTPMRPENPYAVSKAAGRSLCHEYRNQHGLFASVGILYNHESSLRQPKFISRKIVQGAVRIHRGLQDGLLLGDLDAEADWGYAPDTIQAMRLILAAEEADDFIVATGVKMRVQDWVEVAFSKLNLDWKKWVRTTPQLLHRRNPALLGDASHLRAKTGWFPKTTFKEMVEAMVLAELAMPIDPEATST